MTYVLLPCPAGHDPASHQRGRDATCCVLGSDSVERVHTSFGYALFPLILMCQPISEKRVLQLDGVGHDIDEVFVLHRFS